MKISIFDGEVFGIGILAVGTALGTAALTLAALLLLRRVLLRKLRQFAARTATEIDDLVVVVLEQTRRYTLAGAAIYAGSLLLPLSQQAARFAGHAMVLLFFLQGALWGNAFIAFIGRRVESRGGTEAPAAGSAARVIVVIARALLWGVMTLLVLDNLGVNITGLVAGLGIGGIAVALALQNVLGDLFASLSILVDRPFVVGDFISVQDYMGTVERIGLKSTRIRSLSGEQIIMSNADLLASRIRNFKRMEERRVVLPIDLTYQTAAGKVPVASTIIRESIGGQEDARLDRVHFKEFGTSALRIEAVYYVLNPDYNRFMDVQERINLQILQRFANEGIEFAYPTQTVFVRADGG